MIITNITEQEREAFNRTVTHPLQSYEWGEFREKTGVVVVRRSNVKNGNMVSAFQLTIHPLPFLPFTIGYLPKGEMPTTELLEELKKVGEEKRCLFIQIEPNVKNTEKNKQELEKLELKKAAHPLFTKYTFLLDLTKSEEEIREAMHPKTRYNIKIAEKHLVTVQENNSESAFNEYLKLTEETATRQHFYAHSRSYHEKQWQTFTHSISPGKLSSHLFQAIYTPPGGEAKTLVSWMIFVFNDTLYYPYGASSNEHREVMASTLMMWEVIRFGKKHTLKTFDMWGAANTPNPEQSDLYFGFHQFKQRFGATYTEYLGSYDVVIHPLLYKGFVFLNSLRWILLKLKK